MEGSTTESVGASTAEIPGVFGRGIVENESLAHDFGSDLGASGCDLT